MNVKNENLRKAAVLVAALDANAADAVLERLSADHAALVRRMLVDMTDAAGDEEQTVIGEFLGRNEAGGVELELSTYRQPQTAASLPLGPLPEEPQPFRFLHEAAVEDLGELLAGERPQIVAVVVSHLPADQAAQTLAALPAALQTEVMQRLARLDETDPVVLREVEAGLERRFRGRFSQAGRRSAGVGAVRQILNEATADVRRQWLTSLSRNDPRLAEKLTRPSFTFAELDRLTDAALRTLLMSTAEATAAVALAGADLGFAERVAAVLPPVQAAKLQRAIDTLGPTRLSDVDAAQDAIVQAARELETQGRLEWSDAASREYRTAVRPAAAA
jgi:flagellar motor switch protein FliG